MPNFFIIGFANWEKVSDRISVGHRDSREARNSVAPSIGSMDPIVDVMSSILISFWSRIPSL